MARHDQDGSPTPKTKKDGEIDRGGPPANIEAPKKWCVDTCLLAPVVVGLGNVGKPLNTSIPQYHYTKLYVSFTDAPEPGNSANMGIRGESTEKSKRELT